MISPLEPLPFPKSQLHSVRASLHGAVLRHKRGECPMWSNMHNVETTQIAQLPRFNLGWVEQSADDYLNQGNIIAFWQGGLDLNQRRSAFQLDGFATKYVNDSPERGILLLFSGSNSRVLGLVFNQLNHHTVCIFGMIYCCPHSPALHLPCKPDASGFHFSHGFVKV